MSNTQKIIKNLAIALALFLILNIILGIMYGASFLGNLLDSDNQSIKEKLDNLEIDKNTLLLDINISSSNITIKTGKNLKIESNNKYINSKQDKNKFYITERKHRLSHHNKNNELIIYVPKDLIFEEVAIESGAGKVKIYNLSSKELNLYLGAGKVKISNLTVLDNASIDGCTGKMIIDSSSIHNLDLDMGVGKLSITSKLSGDNKIDSGVGEIDLSLLGNPDDYTITLDKGLGSTTIDGKNISDDITYGSGSNKLDINGGVGSIKINFLEKNKTSF
ncbi:MAG: DUF4097 family beta strand repeat-containing protein [Bacilli bacterium]